jgi:hypothetical protein
MTVVDSVAAVRLDEESGRLAGDHRVAHVRSVLCNPILDSEQEVLASKSCRPPLHFVYVHTLST